MPATLARLLYSLLLYLGSPLIWLRLLWRSRRQPEYLAHLGERWGFYPALADTAPLISLLIALMILSVGATWLLIPIGLAFAALYYFMFRFVIRKWNLKTPGREDSIEALIASSPADDHTPPQRHGKTIILTSGTTGTACGRWSWRGRVAPGSSPSPTSSRPSPSATWWPSRSTSCRHAMRAEKIICLPSPRLPLVRHLSDTR